MISLLCRKHHVLDDAKWNCEPSDGRQKYVAGNFIQKFNVEFPTVMPLKNALFEVMMWDVVH